MTSGDDKLCAEASEWLPGVVTCEVKKGIACQAAELLPLDKAPATIRGCRPSGRASCARNTVRSDFCNRLGRTTEISGARPRQHGCDTFSNRVYLEAVRTVPI